MEFGFHPVPKPVKQEKTKNRSTFKAGKGKRAKESEFSRSTRKKIEKRDGDECVFCGRPKEHIHHIKFRSGLGKGTVENGVCVCQDHHDWAHRSREGRVWFELYPFTMDCKTNDDYGRGKTGGMRISIQMAKSADQHVRPEEAKAAVLKHRDAGKMVSEHRTAQGVEFYVMTELNESGGGYWIILADDYQSWEARQQR